MFLSTESQDSGFSSTFKRALIFYGAQILLSQGEHLNNVLTLIFALADSPLTNVFAFAQFMLL